MLCDACNASHVLATIAFLNTLHFPPFLVHQLVHYNIPQRFVGIQHFRSLTYIWTTCPGFLDFMLSAGLSVRSVYLLRCITHSAAVCNPLNNEVLPAANALDHANGLHVHPHGSSFCHQSQYPGHHQSLTTTPTVLSRFLKVVCNRSRAASDPGGPRIQRLYIR